VDRVTKISRANLAMLEFAAVKLAHLRQHFVFLGGCTTALFITDPGAPDIRATLDVDCIVDVVSLQTYYQLERELEKLGFKKSIEDGIICRWHIDDLVLDVMPTDHKILGFSNIWYVEALQHQVSHQLTDSLIIQSVTAPYFLATKLEAFKG
jgi:hypothetical protein